jgi:hypothetical protein
MTASKWFISGLFLGFVLSAILYLSVANIS